MGTAGSQAEWHRQKASLLGGLHDGGIRVAPTLLDDPQPRQIGWLWGPSALAVERREAVRKGRQPNPGLPVKRLHYRSDGDESVAPKFERHTVRPGFAA